LYGDLTIFFSLLELHTPTGLGLLTPTSLILHLFFCVHRSRTRVGSIHVSGRVGSDWLKSQNLAIQLW